jgi:transposase-like protein
MTCHACNLQCVKAGFYGPEKVQRYKCKSCGKRFSEAQDKPLGDVRLADEKVRMILHCLVEGNSVRGTARLCDVEKRTVLRILKLAGENCQRLMERKVRNVEVQDVQIDEAWTFVQKKERRKTLDERHRTDWGDQFVFIGMEANSKLVLAWHVGRRDSPNTWDFIAKLREATAAKPFQVTSDAFGCYRSAMYGLHQGVVSYAQQIKLFGMVPGGRDYYRPAKIKGTLRFQPQARKPPSCALAALRLLQLLSRAFFDQGYARDGERHHRSHLVHRGVDRGMTKKMHHYPRERDRSDARRHCWI